MAPKHRKKILAIEWTWLITGTAVVVAMMLEAWAAPYVPVLWMLGMLALFLAYRFAVTLYEINWPELEPEQPAQPAQAPADARVGGDGIVGTVAYALPQMRGRSVPQEREKMRAEAAAQLAIPSADGQFEDASLDTVFAYVGDDSAPTPPLGVEGAAGRRVKKVGKPGLFGVTVYEYEELRPETEDDMTGTDLPIPSFAESKLTTIEREKALKAAQTRGGVPAMSDAVAAVVNRQDRGPAAPKKMNDGGLFGVKVINPEVLRDEFDPGALRPETEDDITGTDVSIPGFAESQLTSEERDKALAAIRGAEKRPAKKSAPLNADTHSNDARTRTRKPLNLPSLAKSEPPKLDELKRDEMQLQEKTVQRDVPAQLKSNGASGKEKP
jgi:hypothetical protein